MEPHSLGLKIGMKKQAIAPLIVAGGKLLGEFALFEALARSLGSAEKQFSGGTAAARRPYSEASAMLARQSAGQPGADPAGGGFFKTHPIGQTGMGFNPFGASAGALGGYALSKLTEPDTAKERAKRSPLMHPAVLSTLLGVGGGVLPSLFKGGS